MKKRRPILKRQNGFAILFAVSAILLISFIVISLSKDTLIDYRISSKEVERVRAYYAARSGVEMSLFRIQIYRAALTRFGQMIQDPKQRSMLDMIWSMPLPWPPVVGDDINRVQKELIQSSIKDSFMDASFLATITDEGTKIDLNDLGSKSKALRDSTRQQLINLIRSKIESDKFFREEHATTDFEEILNNISDWIDTDTESLNGSAEASYYDRSLGSRDNPMPPNRPFRTIQELRMVSGMFDDLFNLFEPRITVFGTKGINVNHASAEVIMSLSQDLDAEKAAKIVARRSDPVLGPFPSPESFVDWVGSELNISIELTGENAIPIITDSVINFKIKSQGIFNGTSSEIVAVVYDMDKVQARLVDFLKKEDDELKDDDDSGDTSATPSTPNPATASPTDGTSPTAGDSGDVGEQSGPMGRPRIVFWQVK